MWQAGAAKWGFVVGLFLTKQREGGGGRVYVKEKEHSWWVRGGWFWRNPLVPPALPFPCLHGCYRSFTPEPVYPQNTAIDNTVLCIVYTGPTAQKRQMFSSLMSIVTFVATSIGVPYVVLTFTVYVVGAWDSIHNCRNKKNQPAWQKNHHAQGQGYQHIHIKYSKKEIFFNIIHGPLGDICWPLHMSVSRNIIDNT